MPSRAPRSARPASLPLVKSPRLWLLLLLAVLLPLRGAMAAAMLCPPAGAGSPTEAVAGTHHHEHEHEAAPAGADHGEARLAAHAHGASSAHDHGAATPAMADDCDLCAAFCSVATVLSSPPAFDAAQDLGAFPYPNANAPSPSFLSSGPERPPRSI